jgi:hypothetical protein
VKPLRIWLVGTGTVGTWLAGVLGSQPERLAARYGLDAALDQWCGAVLSALPGREEGLTMSERAPAPGSSGDEPNGEPGALDDTHEAALMREVLRAQEQHREGGVEPGLDDPDTPAGSSA